MTYSVEQLSPLLDLLVEAVLVELESPVRESAIPFTPRGTVHQPFKTPHDHGDDIA